ncbi:hypothetical protein [Aliagarivorans marinus]|uniref:hypothetical protein n=1 Tax=Aliagarivorans marinus TaxID=561965 RepID=UPI000426ABA5|nr:hypothetical protein [Aliagarivorans marinus]
MFELLLRPLLHNLWRLSSLLSFPLIAYLYCQVNELSFADLDQGSNWHKGAVVGLYLVYLLVWWKLNPRVGRVSQHKL